MAVSFPHELSILFLKLVTTTIFPGNMKCTYQLEKRITITPKVNAVVNLVTKKQNETKMKMSIQV